MTLRPISIPYSNRSSAFLPYRAVTAHSCETRAKIAALKLASLLTDPICKARDYFYSFYTLKETCKTKIQKITKVAFLTLGIIACTVWAPFTTPLGALIRRVVTLFQSKPYVYWQQEGRGKILPENKKITLLSHNVCYMPGYCITDGQVTPVADKERMKANIAKIKELKPDIVSLYEVHDVWDATAISAQLPEYPYLIPVVGTQTVGPSSGMYIASKYEIVQDSIQYTPFLKGSELTGRAKYSEKGILSFDIKSGDSKRPFATIFSTHLQHSEMPAHPEAHEQKSRALQMHRVAEQIQAKIRQNGTAIFTGDLNQEENELQAFFRSHQIDWLQRDRSVQGQATWGGDTWCAKLMGKTPSGPLVLDYTFIAGKAASISTKIIGTGYSGLEFRPEATSDHNPLFSTIELR